MYFAARHKEASMQFSSSLKFNHVFRRLYNKGDSCANRYLVIYCRKTARKRNRIGLTVGAKQPRGRAQPAAPPPARNLPAARGAVCPGLRYRCGRAHGCHAGSFTGNWRGPICVWPKAWHLCAGRIRGDEGHMEAGAARAHPVLSALYFAGTSEKVPVLADYARNTRSKRSRNTAH